MPTGVTVSQQGRIFVNFPKWGDDVPFTVGEIRGGEARAYPNQAINETDTNDPAADTCVGAICSSRSRRPPVDSRYREPAVPADPVWWTEAGLRRSKTDQVVKMILFLTGGGSANHLPQRRAF